MGFRSENNSPALSPSPNMANANTDQIAPCVYWPPFSRMPGGYALMYPGSSGVLSKGGVKSRTKPSSRRTRYFSTAAMARADRLGSAARDITLHDWAIESMRHSLLDADP